MPKMSGRTVDGQRGSERSAFTESPPANQSARRPRSVVRKLHRGGACRSYGPAARVDANDLMNRRRTVFGDTPIANADRLFTISVINDHDSRSIQTAA